MKPIIIIANTPSENTFFLRQSVAEGVRTADLEPVVLNPFEAEAEHILQASVVILGTTENFGYMSGALKDFFERIYYPCLEQTQGLSVALYIRAGLDGTGAKQSVQNILNGLRWNLIQEPLVLKGEFQSTFLTECQELGEAIAEGYKMGIF